MLLNILRGAVSVGKKKRKRKEKRKKKRKKIYKEQPPPQDICMHVLEDMHLLMCGQITL